MVYYYLRPITGAWEVQMETVRSPKPSTYEISGPVCLMILFILVMALLTGCANLTVVRLAEMCHAAEGHPAVTFSSESGKVDCR